MSEVWFGGLQVEKRLLPSGHGVGVHVYEGLKLVWKWFGLVGLRQEVVPGYLLEVVPRVGPRYLIRVGDI